jgi:hypothetical protein
VGWVDRCARGLQIISDRIVLFRFRFSLELPYSTQFALLDMLKGKISRCSFIVLLECSKFLRFGYYSCLISLIRV